MRMLLLPLAPLLLVACSAEPPPAANEQAPPARPAVEAPPAGPAWRADGAAALQLLDGTGEPLLFLSCTTGTLTARAPAFEPIDSEDRFSLGLGNEPVTLVANPYEQEPGAGVRGEGPVPDDLAALLERADVISALYGIQQVGPHPAPPQPLRRAFAAACSG